MKLLADVDEYSFANAAYALYIITCIYSKKNIFFLEYMHVIMNDCYEFSCIR